jgi:Tfp pilus assembly protein PilV
MGERMMRKLNKAEAGFTLTETVLAAMIFGFAVGACIVSFSMAMRAVNAAGNQMSALHSARDVLESLRTNRFSSAALNVGTNSFTNAYFASGQKYVVTSDDASNRTVSVSVQYVNHIHGGYSTNTLVTLLSSTLHP